MQKWEYMRLETGRKIVKRINGDKAAELNVDHMLNELGKGSVVTSKFLESV